MLFKKKYVYYSRIYTCPKKSEAAHLKVSCRKNERALPKTYFSYPEQHVLGWKSETMSLEGGEEDVAVLSNTELSLSVVSIDMPGRDWL